MARSFLSVWIGALFWCVAALVSAEVVGPGAGSIVADPSFEAGTPSPVWGEFSVNFGTPLCTEATCSAGGGSGARTGEWWAWFGGVAGVPEEGRLSQRVTIPAAETVGLRLYVENTSCSGVSTDVLEAVVGGTTVWQVFGDDSTCGDLGYREVLVEISEFAGQTVELELRSLTSGDGGVIMNFFVDDIEIVAFGEPEFDFQITGSCPGMTNLVASGGTPNGTVGLIFSDAPGDAPLAAGPCAGTPSGLASPTLFTLLSLDAAGELDLVQTATDVVCGRFIQLVDSAAGCVLSNVTQVP